MALTMKQIDVTESALDASARVGLYQGLMPTLEEFRARNCDELVVASQKSCPLQPATYGTALVTFREHLRDDLETLGYAPQIQLQLLCAVRRAGEELVPWTWGDWCDHLARRL